MQVFNGRRFCLVLFLVHYFVVVLFCFCSVPFSFLYFLTCTVMGVSKYMNKWGGGGGVRDILFTLKGGGGGGIKIHMVFSPLMITAQKQAHRNTVYNNTKRPCRCR